MINILDSCDKNQQVFMVAGKKLTISAPEFEMIFGIASGSIDIDMKNSSVGEHSLGNYTFSEHNLITPKHLKEQIMKPVTSTEPRDIENTVKMMILHVMACVLFVASSNAVRWWMLRICINLYCATTIGAEPPFILFYGDKIGSPFYFIIIILFFCFGQGFKYMYASVMKSKRECILMRT